MVEKCCNVTQIVLKSMFVVMLFVGQMAFLSANSANKNSLLMSGPWALNSWSDADPNFLRFGRSDYSNNNAEAEAMKRTAQSANFLRFGRSMPYDPNFLRFGRQPHKVDQSYLRFGRSTNKGNNFLRFGRSQGLFFFQILIFSLSEQSEAEAFEREYRQSNNPNFLRFG